MTTPERDGLKTLKNKPRVFLSHSKRDEDFIKQLHEDLRRCQVDPWLDAEDIRHGEPWLDAIFESGIAACDCILVYLTDSSIDSPMVRKEIDASVLQKLRDNKVGFLPYVSRAELRGRLRADLQSLQVNVWNAGNYAVLLPRVVAEIWRSFFERSVTGAVSEERARRLELELELERTRQGAEGSIFSRTEDNEFSYIWGQLDREENATFRLSKGKTGGEELVAEHNVCIRLRTLIPFLGGTHSFAFSDWSVVLLLHDHIGTKLLAEQQQYQEVTERAGEYPQLARELLMFGLVAKHLRESGTTATPSATSNRLPFHSPPPECIWIFTPKMERLKYWLAYNGMMPNAIEWKRTQAGRPEG